MKEKQILRKSLFRTEGLKEMQFLINSFIINSFIIIFLLRNMDTVISGFAKWVMVIAIPLYLLFYCCWVLKSVNQMKEKTKEEKQWLTAHSNLVQTS